MRDREYKRAYHSGCKILASKAIGATESAAASVEPCQFGARRSPWGRGAYGCVLLKVPRTSLSPRPAVTTPAPMRARIKRQSLRRNKPVRHVPRMRPLQGIADRVPVTHHFAFDVQNAEVAVAHGHLLERPPPERGLLARVVHVRGRAEALRVAAAVGDRARRLRAAGHLLPGPVDVLGRLALAVVAPALQVAGPEPASRRRRCDDVNRVDGVPSTQIRVDGVRGCESQIEGKGRGAKREPARVVDDVRRRDL